MYYVCMCDVHVPMHTLTQCLMSLACVYMFVHTIDRRKKGKKEYAVHYVKEGPKVDTTCKEALATEPEYVAGDCISIMCMCVHMTISGIACYSSDQ